MLQKREMRSKARKVKNTTVFKLGSARYSASTLFTNGPLG